MYTITYSFRHANGEQMPTPLTAERRSMRSVNSFIARLIAWCNDHGKTNLVTVVTKTAAREG